MKGFEEGIEILFNYIYKEGSLNLEELNEDVIEYIKGFRPPLPANEFPEDFPDDRGYDGRSFDLYRGLSFTTEQDYDQFIKEINEGVYRSNRPSSWSLSDAVAERFAKGASTKNKDVYKGVVVKTERVRLESILFATMRLHPELEFEFEEELSEIENTKLHSLHEEEFVLMPGEYEVTVLQID